MSRKAKTKKKISPYQKYQSELAEYIQALEREEASSDDILNTTIIQSSPTMSDSEVVLAAPIRKKMRRTQSQIHDIKEQLSEQRAEENAATSDFEFLSEIQEQIEIYREECAQQSESLYDIETDPTAAAEDAERARKVNVDIRSAKKDCKYLMSARSILLIAETLETAVRCLVSAFAADPTKKHTTTRELVLDTSKELTAEMRLSPLSERHELKQRAREVLEQSSLILGKLSGDVAAEVKPVIHSGSGKGGVKVKPMEVPEFSGQTEDWTSFFRLFKSSVHENPDLETSTKLHHLVQALQDPTQKSMFAERMDETNAYDTFIKELTEKYDKPRWMHRRYCQNMKDLSTNQHTREGLTQLVSQVTQIHNGFCRLKATDAKQILTSLTESIMDPKLRELWYQRTDAVKETPPIEELLKFITAQAIN